MCRQDKHPVKERKNGHGYRGYANKRQCDPGLCWWRGRAWTGVLQVRVRKRRDGHRDRTENHRGAWGRSWRPTGESRSDEREALQGWHEVCFAIALNAVNILVLCLSVNIQFSLIQVLLWVTGSLAEFTSPITSQTYTRGKHNTAKISLSVVYA